MSVQTFIHSPARDHAPPTCAATRERAAPERYWFWMRPPLSHLTGIIRDVAERHALTLDDLLGPSKRRPIAHARQEAMWELRQRTRLTYPRIAHCLGRSDHTTAIHGVRAHAARAGRS